MPAPAEILKLVERFEQHREAYVSPSYNETQLRREFVDPFFKGLGWDVENEAGYAEAYKDVVHEDAIRVGGATKAPDYSFRIGGVRKFFVETKKPSLNLKDDPRPAFQLRRYAWSAKLPLSVLTDFEELAVYNCRVRPSQGDKASKERVLYIRCDEYADRWDEIAGIFSREAILKGSFDRFARSQKKRGTAEVDAEFLAEIEGWRDLLAKNIALRNPGLSQRELNFAVQRTIDRIIFLRICEDRGIEKHGQLQALLKPPASGGRQPPGDADQRSGTSPVPDQGADAPRSPGIYPRLCELFRQADDRYNSGLFHFQAERDRQEAPDGLTLGLKLDDRPLREIVRKLYYPESPYEFSVIGADILGQVYEQFLGKVIRLTAGGRAVVEEKPEVRKAGGVYYTPTYIVEYIVRNTLGKLLDGETPRQAAKLRVLDPACGSGSFLIGAYQYLLDWHRDWYTANDPQKWLGGKNPVIYEGPRTDPDTPNYRLTTGERKRILLNSIYGVDLDPLAVEVTKLSLLLKVLEGENRETLRRQLKLFRERALPDLGNNIKCGNSLIGPDFYADARPALFDDEDLLRINAFDWPAEFPDIMQAGGFDAVIGNPPYGFHQIHASYLKPYFKRHYVASQGSFEHYFLFYERSLRLLKAHGHHGFIAPVTWLTIPSARSLREFILKNYHVARIAWLPELVFANAQVNTLVSIISNEPPNGTDVEIYDVLGFVAPPCESKTISQSQFVADDFSIGIFSRSEDVAIIEKLELVSQPLSSYARPCSGYNPYEVGKGLKPGGGPHSKATVAEKPYHADRKLNNEWKPEIVGRDLGRYTVNVTGKRWIKYGPWLAAARDSQNFVGRRILVQEIVGGRERRLIAAYCDDELYHSRDVIPIKIDGDLPHPFYLLGIINSRLMTWYHHRRNPKAKKGLFPKVLVSDLRRLPIAEADESNAQWQDRHNRMVELVQRMHSLHESLASARTAHEQTAVRRQLEATDGQIDRLVYELYGLADEEIAVVEAS